MSLKTHLVGLLVLCSLLIAACSLSSLASQQDIIPVTGVESGNSSQFNASNTENESVPENDGRSLSCFEAEAFILQADHTLIVNQAETSITHILKQGAISLIKSNNTDQGDYTVSSVVPQTLNYEVIGVAGPCSIEANGTMLLSAQGYCQDGIIYLTINENWQAAQGTMTCDGDVKPFTVPGYSAVHTGPYGLGEEFLILNDSNGHTVLSEFIEGDGYHAWTLITDIASVPLVQDGE